MTQQRVIVSYSDGTTHSVTFESRREAVRFAEQIICEPSVLAIVGTSDDDAGPFWSEAIGRFVTIPQDDDERSEDDYDQADLDAIERHAESMKVVW